MDKRTIQALMLMLAVYFGWMAFFPPKPPVEQAVDSEVPAQVAASTEGQSAAATPSAAPTSAPTPAPVPTREVEFKGCESSGTVMSSTGTLRSLSLENQTSKYDMQSIFSWALSGFDGPWKPYGEPPGPEMVLSDRAQALVAWTGDVKGAAGAVTVVEESPTRIVTRGQTSSGVEVTRTLEAVDGADGACTLQAKVTWRNVGPNAVTEPLWVGVHDALPEDSSRYAAATRPVFMADDSVDTFDDLEDLGSESERSEGTVQWFGLADAYFAFLVKPQASGPAGYAQADRIFDVAQESLYGVHYIVDEQLAPGAQVTKSFQLYAGAKELGALEAADESFTKAVQLGFFSLIAYPLLVGLKMMYGFLGNWGLAIAGLTIIMKGIFFPLTQKGFKSSQAMQAIQPQVKELREQYKDNPEVLNREMMKVWQENGVNPLGGCLPMLVQMPVWFALYGALLGSVELYHAEFLYIKDLSAIDPYMIMPALCMGLMVLQQRFAPTGNMDPAQARIMKLMPLFFGIFFFSFPAGLVVYIFMNMLLSIAQQWYIKRTFSPSKSPAAA